MCHVRRVPVCITGVSLLCNSLRVFCAHSRVKTGRHKAPRTPLLLLLPGASGPGFASAAEQRGHFRSDWHRHNARRRAAGRPPLAEDEFERAAADGGELSSISGSDASSSEDEAGAAAARRRRAGAGVRTCFTARGARASACPGASTCQWARSHAFLTTAGAAYATSHPAALLARSYHRGQPGCVDLRRASARHTRLGHMLGAHCQLPPPGRQQSGEWTTRSCAWLPPAQLCCLRAALEVGPARRDAQTGGTLPCGGRCCLRRPRQARLARSPPRWRRSGVRRGPGWCCSPAVATLPPQCSAPIPTLPPARRPHVRAARARAAERGAPTRRGPQPEQAMRRPQAAALRREAAAGAAAAAAAAHLRRWMCLRTRQSIAMWSGA